MKKIIALLAIVGIVFSSCNGKYIIAKRKYTKGFYVSKSGSSSTKPAVADAKTTKVNAPEEKIETVVVAKTDLNTNAVKTNQTYAEIAPVKTMHAPALTAPKASVNDGNAIASTSNNTYSKTSEIKPINITDRMLSTNKKGNSDGNLILMIILCFLWFLNLIAVYMHDGGITTNFWITLLLDFTIIGGVIFSLLVVLDVIDLS